MANDRKWAANLKPHRQAGPKNSPECRPRYRIRHRRAAWLRSRDVGVAEPSRPGDHVEELFNGNHNLLKYINGVGERAWDVHAVVRSVDLQHMR
jgi:hypothetical protein